MERALSQPPPEPGFAFRHPTEADHPAVARRIDEWWGERRPRIPRLWFRQFAGLSWLAERADGRLLGVGIGVVGHDRPARGMVLLLAVAPSHRRRGIGRAVAEAVEQSLAAVGAREAEAMVWPGNRGGVRFLEALGYAPMLEGTEPLYGVPAMADFDGDDEDRAIFLRRLVAP